MILMICSRSEVGILSRVMGKERQTIKLKIRRKRKRRRLRSRTKRRRSKSSIRNKRKISIKIRKWKRRTDRSNPIVIRKPWSKFQISPCSSKIETRMQSRNSKERWNCCPGTRNIWPYTKTVLRYSKKISDSKNGSANIAYPSIS